jgi:Pyridoxamine 5'-phosphate oxidase
MTRLDPRQGSRCKIVGVDQPTFDVLGFLHEPGHPASVATVTGRGRPALAMMWFLVEDDRLWFHTPASPDAPAPFLRAARERRGVAVMVATFDPPADVRQVRMTGPARLEEQDLQRVRRLYQRYVATWTPKWQRQATSANYHLWSMSPDRGMAVSYPGLEDSPTFQWSKPSELFSLRPDTTSAEQR